MDETHGVGCWRDVARGGRGDQLRDGGLGARQALELAEAEQADCTEAKDAELAKLAKDAELAKLAKVPELAKDAELA